MSVKGVGELRLLEKLRPYLEPGAGDDDAAILPDGDSFLVASTDMFVEGVHFDLGWMAPQDVGWRSLALALGDLAAKGATPEWALASLAIPPEWAVEAVTGVYAGMRLLAAAPIVGGDMSSTSGPAVLSLTVAGRTKTRPRMRSEAQPGWAVGVTGPLGAAAVALRKRKPLRLVPMLEEGRRVNALGLCAGDISDGLAREMEKFGVMSGCGSELYAGQVPRAEGASVEDAMTSGEEAQLVCVGPADAVAAAGLHVVGRMTAGGGLHIVGARLDRLGYDHFA